MITIAPPAAGPEEALRPAMVGTAAAEASVGGARSTSTTANRAAQAATARYAPLPDGDPEHQALGAGLTAPPSLERVRPSIDVSSSHPQNDRTISLPAQ